jgi:hypothetical protein
MRVFRIEFHEFVEEDVTDGCHAHGCARMARVGLCGHIDGQTTDCVDAFPVELRVRHFRKDTHGRVFANKSGQETNILLRFQRIETCGVCQVIVQGSRQRWMDPRWDISIPNLL